MHKSNVCGDDVGLRPVVGGGRGAFGTSGSIDGLKPSAPCQRPLGQSRALGLGAYRSGGKLGRRQGRPWAALLRASPVSETSYVPLLVSAYVFMSRRKQPGVSKHPAPPVEETRRSVEPILDRKCLERLYPQSATLDMVSLVWGPEDSVSSGLS